jgi:hypothetical protein
MHRIGRRRPRGMTFVSFLFLVAALSGVWWVISFGPVYWDNVSIKGDLHESANYAMKEPEDRVRAFILKKLAAYPNLTVTPEDVRIDMEHGKYITIDLTYARTVKPLFVDERTVMFSRRVEQDLTPVKW